jgi:DNA excision repair protein ERCC-4
MKLLAVTADVYEQTSGVPRRLEELGLTVASTRLPVGDYLFGASIVERKTVIDLHLSVLQGRLWSQLWNLRRTQHAAHLLVEGPDIDDGPLSRRAVRGVLLSVAGMRVTVVRSTDPSDSAEWLAVLASRQTRRRGREPINHRRKSPSPRGSAVRALAAVPGISMATAASLLDHFGSLAGVLDAPPDAWREVPGIGPRRADALAATLHASRRPTS